MQLIYLFTVHFKPADWMDKSLFERETDQFTSDLHKWISDQPIVKACGVHKITDAQPGEVIPPRPERPPPPSCDS